MKKIILLGLIVGASRLAVGAESPRESEDLNKSFQREYVYLVSQKEAMTRQRAQMEKSFTERTAQAKKQVSEMQRRLTHMTANNDELHEELAGLEKQKKELQRRGTSIESTFKKATMFLAEFEKGLKFESFKDKNPAPTQGDLGLSDLSPIFKKAVIDLRAASKQETFTGYYTDSKDELREGKITRVGRIAAFLEDQDGKVMLGPNGSGPLKVLDRARGNSIYVFDNLTEAARLQRPPTWVESLADIGPIVFLGLMLLVVAGLFLALVRI